MMIIQRSFFSGVTAWNRGPEPAPLHIIPHLWFRNTWAWGHEAEDKKPKISKIADNAAHARHHKLGERYMILSPSPGVGPSGVDVQPELIFTENDTNNALLYKGRMRNQKKAINPQENGTKSAAWFSFNEGGGVAPGECAVVRFRMSQKYTDYLDEEEFDNMMDKRKDEADEFFYRISPLPMADDLRNIQRQAFAGNDVV
ncbi:hypothetical protein EYC84_000852 [Monilinia fructicola]|uniref:Mannosyl-oligosaccharide glucosidase n=1 Tax=Monilinia fructicola TaxID=38448 RepID=A0A5M9JLB9_MONFR|nr:hypothetical protein EYC84_000852 [Monilinia fructicola]